VISRLFHSAAGTSSMEARPERSAYRAAWVRLARCSLLRIFYHSFPA
jgi:hypothetical protein